METHPPNHIRAGNYLFDVDALLRLAHRCEPRLCRDSGSCCAAHDAWIGGEEHERLVHRLSPAAAFASHLRDHAHPFRRLGPDLFVIKKSTTGVCIFAFDSDDGEVLCSLHAAAIEAGDPPEEVKPHGCVLWPLCESASTPPVISVQPGAYDFPCNTRRELSGSLHPGTAELLRAACGSDSLRALRQKLVGRAKST